MTFKKEMVITVLFLILINFVGVLGLYMWWQKHHQAVIVPTTAQTNVVAMETNRVETLRVTIRPRLSVGETKQ